MHNTIKKVVSKTKGKLAVDFSSFFGSLGYNNEYNRSKAHKDNDILPTGSLTKCQGLYIAQSSKHGS
jgi:hypothetical protein